MKAPRLIRLFADPVRCITFFESVAQDPKTARAVRDELADVLLIPVRLSSVLGVDLNEAVTTKLASNAQKYPAGESTPKRR